MRVLGIQAIVSNQAVAHKIVENPCLCDILSVPTAQYADAKCKSSWNTYVRIVGHADFSVPLVYFPQILLKTSSSFSSGEHLECSPPLEPMALVGY